MIANAGAGPRPITDREQKADMLAQKIQEALHPDTKIRADWFEITRRTWLCEWSEKLPSYSAVESFKMLDFPRESCRLGSKR